MGKIDVFLERENVMGRWRSRMLLGLTMYFAGFATAIYALAPAPESAGNSDAVAYHSRIGSELNSRSEKFAIVFNSQMRKCLSFAEEKVVEVSEVVKAKLIEHQSDKTK